jgi:tetratricopeptide (TPR) repeat protein
MAYVVSMQEYAQLVELAQNDPKQACPKVEEFVAYHPQFPPAANLLAYIYIQLKKIEKANRIIEENYHKFPDYLLARINYGDLCLRKKKWDEIPKIFPFFNLKELFPSKKEFSPHEVRGFAVLMGFYHIKIGKQSEAEKFYIQAVEADPSHPSVVLLEKRLFRFSFLRWLKKFLSRITKPC